MLRVLCQVAIVSLAIAFLPESIYDVDLSAAGGGELIGTRFWETTGWCPPDPLNDVSGGFAQFFVSEDMVQNHIMIGSVPRRGIRVVRIHYLLALLKYNATGQSRFPHQFDPSSDFDFSDLDRGLDTLVGLNLSVVFELMGNPGQKNSGSGEGGLFTDFAVAAELRVWRDTARAVVERYIDRYGISVVSEWEWQGWNEPDHHCNAEDRLKAGINCNAQSFVQWHFALAEGVRLGSPSQHLLFGGPNTGGATLDPKNGILPALLKYIVQNNASNVLDFINWHGKGKDVAQHVADLNIEIINFISDNFPSLAAVPVQNDEGDPAGGWSKELDWRGDTRYASVAAKIIDEQLQQIVLRQSKQLKNFDVQFRRNSNDNGFMNYGSPEHVFRQRTLVARFMMNETSTIEVLRKPVLNLMGLLSHLGTHYHSAKPLAVVDTSKTSAEPIGILATSTPAATSRYVTQSTSSSAELSLLIYRSNDTSNCSAASPHKVTIRLEKVALAVPEGSLEPVSVTYLIDDSASHSPLVNWTAMGSPTYPTAEEFASLRASANVHALAGPSPVRLNDGSLSLDFGIPCPAVLLYHVCSPVGNAASKPEAPARLRLRVTPSHAPAEVVVFWEGLNSTCILTYEVLYSTTKGGSMTHVNKGDSFFSAFVHAQVGVKAVGCYQVRAVDYWGRQGILSEITCVEGTPELIVEV